MEEMKQEAHGATFWGGCRYNFKIAEKDNL